MPKGLRKWVKAFAPKRFRIKAMHPALQAVDTVKGGSTLVASSTNHEQLLIAIALWEVRTF
ncbi:hypothetical protein KCTCHS21_26520 [Cohnella abietis]|uniref:Uncharacterized protein n=1 Tax=Cohnella abietis TaxID=2507935 RepID=A0A3T1D564_9BACL|nr:hypothetical protein KCTCHS21_26520 [Cohnella abietis]